MPHARRAEEGFVLIGTVWLLLLCATIVALLMLKASTSTKAAAEEGVNFQRTLDLDAAIETATAELVIEGPRSRWWRLPARGTVTIGDRRIDIAITSELGRLDLNTGDIAIIDRALRRLGYLPSARNAFLTRLAMTRASGRINSSASVDALLASLPNSGATACPQDIFTIDSGQLQPQVDRIGDVLAHALGLARPEAFAQLRSGESIRIIAQAPEGALTTVVGRIGMVKAAPLAQSRRWPGISCANS